MVVLAFLSDPPVVEKILRHLKLPTSPPAMAPARSTSAGLFPRLAPNPPQNAGSFPLSEACSLRHPVDDEGGEEEGSRPQPQIRPPPRKDTSWRPTEQVPRSSRDRFRASVGFRIGWWGRFDCPINKSILAEWTTDLE
jgi:hypothetical protein